MKKLMMVLSSLIVISVGAMQPPTKASSAAAPAIDQKLQNAFVQAAQENNLNEITRLLKFRPRIHVNASNEFYDRALDWAVRNKNYNMVRLLLDQGADPNLIIRGGMQPGITQLMQAAEQSDLEMVKLLLEYGADGNIEYNDTFNRRRGGASRRAVDFLRGGAHDAQIRQLLSKKKLL